MMEENIDRIVQLDIDLDGITEAELEELGVEVISLVDEPAIGVNFLAFKSEEFIKPHAGESENDFIGRCMHDLKGEFPDEEQRLAVCYNYYENFEGEEYFSDEAQDALIEYATDNGEMIDSDDIIIDISNKEFSTIKDTIEAIRGLDLLKRLKIGGQDEAETYWRYTGPPAERKFCKAMINLSKAGKIFSKKEIDKMNALNSQFAKKGESSYSIFKYKGGKNCKHYWQKLSVWKNDQGQRIIMIGQPTNSSEEKATTRWANLSNHQFAIDEEKRMVTGPVMIPNKMILRRDVTGEPYYIFFSRDTIKKMAEKFLKMNKHNNTDTQHDGKVTQANTLIETWISEDKMYDKAYKMGFALPQGTWYVTYKINEEKTWAEIKDGKLKGFSLAGGFIEKMASDSQHQAILNGIMDILKRVDDA